MFLQNAEVHHNREPRITRFLRGDFMDYALLQPYRGNIQAYGFVDDLRHELRPAENVDEIDLLRNFSKTAVGPRSQNFSLIRIHWNDAVSLSLHPLRNAKTRTHRIGR